MSHTKPERGFDAPPAVPAPPCVTATAEEATPAECLAEWFEKEVHAHDGQLKAWLRGQFPSIRDVEDVAQESYLRIWTARSAHTIASTKAFLFTVARRIALNLLRRQRHSPVEFDGDLVASGVLDDRPGAAELITEQEKIDLLTDALAALPARTRVILVLHKFEGLSQAEVAQRCRLTIKAVEHQVARGIQLCADYLHTRGHDFF